jgi:hypothetical protein
MREREPCANSVAAKLVSAKRERRTEVVGEKKKCAANVVLIFGTLDALKTTAAADANGSRVVLKLRVDEF